MKKCIDKAAIENILHKLWKKDTGYEYVDIARIAYNRALQDVQKAIDSKQEEPVSIWHDVSEEPKEGFTIVVYMKDDSLKVLTSWGENGDFCIGEGFWYNIHQQRKWAYVDDLLNLSNVERTVKDRKEKPVSEDKMTISKEWFEHCKKSWYNEGYIDGEYNRDRQFEEPVSEELEDFAKRQADEFAEREYEVDSYDRGCLSKGYYWGCKAGAKWQLAKIKSITLDDLGEFINELSKQFPEVSFAKVCKIATRTAKWLLDVELPNMEED